MPPGGSDAGVGDDEDGVRGFDLLRARGGAECVDRVASLWLGCVRWLDGLCLIVLQDESLLWWVTVAGSWGLARRVLELGADTTAVRRS